jgi:hypothetical protein
VAVPLITGAEATTVAAQRPRIAFTEGAAPGSFRIAPRTRTPLALVSVTAGNGQRYAILSSGTDFSEPTVWLRRGAGTLCWAERPTTFLRDYRVRDAAVPFAAPRAAWAWSTIVLIGRGGPRTFTDPVAGDVLTTGQRVRRVVLCVDPRFASSDTIEARAYRSDAPAPSPSPTPVSPTPGPSASSELPQVPDAGTFVKPEEEKVTICHATSSASNPYSLITVDQSSIEDKNGHGSHTGPLYPEPGWGDVIPPFDGYPGLNWPDGSLLLEDGCELTEPTDPTDPPDTDVEPPDPGAPMPPIYLPIEIAPPIYLPEPTPTPTVTPSPSATPTVSVRPTPSATPSASPSASPSVTPTASGSPAPTTTSLPSAPAPSSGPGSGQSASPTVSVPPTASPTVATPAPPTVPVPGPGQVRFTLTDGERTFSVIRPATLLAKLARIRDLAKCPEPGTGAGRLRGC